MGSRPLRTRVGAGRRAGSRWTHDESDGRRGGKRVFREKRIGPAGGRPGVRRPIGRFRAPLMRRLRRSPPGGGLPGAGCFYACDARGSSMRPHVGFMMDPTPARGPDRVPSRSGCRICRDPPAALPPAGKFPMLPKRVCRACRSIGGGAGGRAIGDQMEGGGGARDRPAATVRGSGCPCACGARVAHAICKRYRRYIPTQIYSYAEYAAAEYAYADIT